jgi:hypothetical protein
VLPAERELRRERLTPRLFLGRRHLLVVCILRQARLSVSRAKSIWHDLMKVVTVAADAEPRMSRAFDIVAGRAVEDVSTAAVDGHALPSRLQAAVLLFHSTEANPGNQHSMQGR